MALTAMAKKKNMIIVNQVLHGYKSGHKLLSSSLELSDIERRTMLALSDYSGSGLEKGFKEYLTGYPISSSKFYVLAKTWYADEMKRPGCVWTQSFLIDFTDLLVIKDMRILLKYFNRPQAQSDFSSFSKTILIPQEEVDNRDSLVSETFFKISCRLYTLPTKGIVLLDENSNYYESDVLQIWNWQWPKLKRSFTFSTGSLSLRRLEEQPFDLQILPYRRERNISLIDREQFSIVDLIDNNECLDNWFTLYKSANLVDLHQFMVKYGSDISGNRENFTLLLEFWNFFKSKSQINIGIVDRLINKDLLNAPQGRLLKIQLAETLLSKNNIEKSSVLNLLLTNNAFKEIKWNYSALITGFWQKQQLNENEISEILLLLINKDEEEFLESIGSIPLNLWVHLILNKNELLNKVLHLYPQLQFEKSIWHLQEGIQISWLKALKENSLTNWSNVISSMLEAGITQFANELYEHLDLQIIEILIGWVTQHNKPLLGAWYDLLWKDKFQVLKNLIDQEHQNRELIRIFLDVLSPYDFFWRDISLSRVRNYLLLVDKTDIEPETTGIYTFLLTACYDNKFSNPEALINIIFQPLHNKLKNNLFHARSWERFKWHIGKDLYGIIEQNYLSKFFNDKNRVPDWDHCELLRRSIIVAFLNNRWDPMNLVFAVSEKGTFEQVVAFGCQIKDANKLFKAIAYKLKLSHYESSIHFKVINKYL